NDEIAEEGIAGALPPQKECEAAVDATATEKPETSSVAPEVQDENDEIAEEGIAGALPPQKECEAAVDAMATEKPETSSVAPEVQDENNEEIELSENDIEIEDIKEMEVPKLPEIQTSTVQTLTINDLESVEEIEPKELGPKEVVPVPTQPATSSGKQDDEKTSKSENAQASILSEENIGDLKAVTSLCNALAKCFAPGKESFGRTMQLAKAIIDRVHDGEDVGVDDIMGIAIKERIPFVEEKELKKNAYEIEKALLAVYYELPRKKKIKPLKVLKYIVALAAAAAIAVHSPQIYKAAETAYHSPAVQHKITKMNDNAKDAIKKLKAKIKKAEKNTKHIINDINKLF
ncbi:MAG: hypothetical protein N3G76_01725, partial [Candidatus Micrarchaeota archaeon]|nr:hypothetical protein [Candidatus Micrarchaeota archaeon]